MGNKCCCCKNDNISKLDEQLDNLINSESGKNITVADCSFCENKNAVCFKNYGSVDDKKIMICICCDIELETRVLGATR